MKCNAQLLWGKHRTENSSKVPQVIGLIHDGIRKLHTLDSLEKAIEPYFEITGSEEVCGGKIIVDISPEEYGDFEIVARCDRCSNTTFIVNYPDENSPTTLDELLNVEVTKLMTDFVDKLERG